MRVSDLNNEERVFASWGNPRLEEGLIPSRRNEREIFLFTDSFFNDLSVLT